jgi:hypothetical protein
MIGELNLRTAIITIYASVRLNNKRYVTVGMLAEMDKIGVESGRYGTK